MRLVVNGAYKSIPIDIFKTEDNAFELGDFSVITGTNGSGKSHLLEAIRDGKIHIKIYGKLYHEGKPDDPNKKYHRIFTYKDFEVSKDETPKNSDSVPDPELEKRLEVYKKFANSFYSFCLRLINKTDFHLYKESLILLYSIPNIANNAYGNFIVLFDLYFPRDSSRRFLIEELPEPKKDIDKYNDFVKKLRERYLREVEDIWQNSKRDEDVSNSFWDNRYSISDFILSLHYNEDLKIDSYEITRESLWKSAREKIHSSTLYEGVDISYKPIRLTDDYFSYNYISDTIRHAIHLRKAFEEQLDEHEKAIFEKIKKDGIDLSQPIHYHPENWIGEAYQEQCRWYMTRLQEKVLENNNYQKEKDETLKAPWEILNDVLRELEINDYQVKEDDRPIFKDNPKDWNTEHFSLSLSRHGSPACIGLDSLSSGEKIMLALAMKVFNTKYVYNTELRSNTPVLLLDEVDTNLHPKMLKTLIDILGGFVEKEYVRILMVTHSPTTIALAPDNAKIYFMKNPAKMEANDKRFEEMDKNEAIENLSGGLISLKQGLDIYESFTSSKKTLFILTEGNNIEYLERAFEIHAKELSEKIHFEKRVSDISSAGQLNILFRFFSQAHTNSSKKILLIYDCDVPKIPKDKETKCVLTYQLPKNTENNKALKGIENMFDESLFKEFFKFISPLCADKTYEKFTLKNNKKKFQKFILEERSNPDDFHRFKPVIEKIKTLLTATEKAT